MHLGTIWNSWETQWSGVVNTRVSGRFTRDVSFTGNGMIFDRIERTVQTV